MFKVIECGDVDVMIIGGVEVLIIKMLFVGFIVNKVLLLNLDLEIVCCLFDKDCDGFIIGEGVGIVILEEYEYVKVCGVKIYVEIVGYGVIGDVYYIIVLVLNGEGVVCVMKMVIDDVGFIFDKVDYINVYGISILYNDEYEI